MAIADSDWQLTATELWTAPEASSPHFAPDDASLRAWLEASESMQRWWTSDATATRDDTSLAEDWLVGHGGQRVGMAVTISGAEGRGRSLRDPEPLVTRSAPTAREVGAGAHDVPVSLRDPESDADAPPWAETPRRGAAAAAAAVGSPRADARAPVRVDAGLDPVWPPAEAVLLAHDEPVWPAPEAARLQDTPEEIALAPAARAAGRDERVVVVNVSGLEDADIADMAVEQYEAAQARRRFRAYVPG
ncbi:MAG: hypothetical protein ACE5JM_09575 [Armatimonadota bacterium]